MNKKEQAQMDALTDQLAKLQFEAAAQQLINRALRWTGPVAPDVAPPKWAYGNDDATRGWLFNVHVERVAPASSGAVSHNYGSQDYMSGGRTQGARWLFSTRLRALQALRYEVEQVYARRLAAIDAEIEKESMPTPPTP
jgi:hypothetical protein